VEIAMIKILTLLLIFSLVAVSVSLAADEPAGSLRNVKGGVFIDRGGTAVKAEDGTPVYPQDKVRTGSDGAAGIIFRDNSRISLGPDSILDINRLIKGIASFISGKMTKLSPESVLLETPTSTIGVRGTSFHIKVSGD
jgi:hypothetical protein